MSLTTDLEDRLSTWFRYPNHDTLSRAVIVISGLLLVECLLFFRMPPAASYETSLTAAFPLPFWVLFYSVLVGGICIVAVAPVVDSSYWRHGIALVLADYAIFFFLPAARGYKLYHRGEADILRHLGDVKELTATGSLAINFYPGLHTLMAELNMMGMPLSHTTYFTAFLFTALFILGVGVLVRTLSERRKGIAAGLAVGSPLVFTSLHLTNHPAMLSFMMLPVFVALLEQYRRSNATAYLMLLVILGLFVMYTHPMTTIFLSVVVLTTAGYSVLHRRMIDTTVRTINPRLGLVFPVLLFGWLTNSQRTKYALTEVLTASEKATPSGRVTQKAAEITFTPVELAAKFLNLYGTLAVYFLVTSLIVLSVFTALLRRDVSYEFGVSAMQFTVGSALFVTFLGFNIIVNRIVRPSRYAVLFAAVLIALMFLKKTEQRDVLAKLAIILVVLGTAVIGANAAYEPNHHLTHAEYDGTEYIETYNQNERIYSADTTHKMEEFVLGSGHPDLWPPHISDQHTVPRNLGYVNESATAEETFGNSVLVTKEYDREQHTSAYFTPEQQELLFIYDDRDIERLGRDRTANKVYSNGGLQSWDITSNP